LINFWHFWQQNIGVSDAAWWLNGQNFTLNNISCGGGAHVDKLQRESLLYYILPFTEIENELPNGIEYH